MSRYRRIWTIALKEYLFMVNFIMLCFTIIFSAFDAIVIDNLNLNHFFKFRSSNQSCSINKGVLKNLAKYTGKHLCQQISWVICFLPTVFRFSKQMKAFPLEGWLFFSCHISESAFKIKFSHASFPQRYGHSDAVSRLKVQAKKSVSTSTIVTTLKSLQDGRTCRGLRGQLIDKY